MLVGRGDSPLVSLPSSKKKKMEPNETQSSSAE